MVTPSSVSIIEARDLLVHRSGKLVLSVGHFEIQEGEILAVIGPNGAGKSTLLLALAQLLKPTRGEIFFRGNSLKNGDDLGYRRRIALVLQDPLLLDTSVFDNVTIGLRFRGVPRKEARTRSEDWVTRLGIADLKSRKSHQLSGGEAQRVSLARAFAINPDVLFLDEPFGALDAPTRTHLLDDFHGLLSQTRMTTVIITHDMDEALMLGDRVAVIINGELRQIGKPEMVFSNPADVDVAALVGVETVLAGRVTQTTDGHVYVDTCGVQIEAVGEIELGREVMLFLRPEDVTLWIDGELPLSSARNRLVGKIQRIMPQGPLMKVVVDCLGCEPGESVQIVALVTRASAQDMGLAEGVQVTVTFKASAVHLIPR